MSTKLTFAASVLCALLFAGQARAVTYDVSGTNLAGDMLTGTIVGDATLSTITSINLTDSALQGPLVFNGYANSVLSATGLDAVQGAIGLVIDFTSNPAALLANNLIAYNAGLAIINTNFDASVCNGDVSCQTLVLQEKADALATLQLQSYSPFAATATVGVSATPLPASLPMFISGMAAIGLIGWFVNKRKAATLAAA